MKRRTSWFACATVALLLMMPAAPVLAEHEKGDGHFEVYGGLYSVEGDFGGDATFGLRGSYNFTKKFSWESQVGRVEFSENENDPATRIDTEVLLFDASFMYAVNPTATGVFYAFGGPGWAAVDASATGGILEDDTPTFHVGLGVRADAGRAFVRPDLRVRYFEDCRDDCVQWELTVSIGAKF